MTAGEVSNIHRLTGHPCPAPAQDPGSELAGPASVPAQGRALVRLASLPTDNVKTARALPAANFLAHLIATADGAPQTRLRRRAEPDLADATYAAASAFAAPAGRILHRTA